MIKILTLLALISLTALASNETIDSFSKAKRLLEQRFTKIIVSLCTVRVFLMKIRTLHYQ